MPLVPGTFASIAGIFIFYLIKDCILVYITVTLVLIILGFLLCGKGELLFNKKDARYIVIDEVVGMLLSLIFIPYNFRLVIIAFIMFRILDTLKPYPIARFEYLKGSMGVMGDDIVAGLYANIILQLIIRFATFRAS